MAGHLPIDGRCLTSGPSRPAAPGQRILLKPAQRLSRCRTRRQPCTRQCLGNGADQGTVVSLGEALFGEFLRPFVQSNLLYSLDVTLVRHFCTSIGKKSSSVKYKLGSGFPACNLIPPALRSQIAWPIKGACPRKR